MPFEVAGDPVVHCGDDDCGAAGAVRELEVLIGGVREQLADVPGRGVLEVIQRLVVVPRDQDGTLGREDGDEARFEQREVLVFVDDDQRIDRDSLVVRVEEAEHPVDDVGVRDGLVVVAEAKGVADYAVQVVERVQRPLNVVLLYVWSAQQTQVVHHEVEERRVVVELPDKPLQGIEVHLPLAEAVEREYIS